MSLQITKNQNVYEISGSLNSSNVKLLITHFNQLIGRSKLVMLSLNKIQDIDRIGVDSIHKMYQQAMSKNTVLYILGRSNKKVNTMFTGRKIQYLLHTIVLNINS